MFCWNWNNFILSIRKIVFLLLTNYQENFRPRSKNASTTYIRLVKNINGHDISAHRVPDSWTEHSTDEDLGFKTIFAEYENFLDSNSLRSRRLEVVGTRKNGRARRRHARGEVAPSPFACLPQARPFSLSPTTSKRLLCRLWQQFHDTHFRLFTRGWNLISKP